MKNEKRLRLRELFVRADELTETTRNEIVRHHDVIFVNEDFLVSARETCKDHKGFIHDYLVGQGFTAQHTFEPLTEPVARLALRKILTDSAAYGNSNDLSVGPDDPSPEADQLVQDFFNLIESPKETLYLNLRSYNRGDGVFESGLIIVDTEKIVYIWYEETD